MPVHDWTRVSAGTFHDFHNGWITHLKEALNSGLLPSGYYSMAEQWAGRMVADILALQLPPAGGPPPTSSPAGVAVAETPPRVGRRLSASPTARGLRRTLVIRHTSGHRVVAVIEIISPANKDRASSVAAFAERTREVLESGVHVLMVDLFPPGPHDPRGLHGTIWEQFDPEPYLVPENTPLALASYVGGPSVEAYVEHLAVGASLAEMPLFLDPDWYINTPLEETYAAAFRGMPGFWREVVEGRRESPG